MKLLILAVLVVAVSCMHPGHMDNHGHHDNPHPDVGVLANSTCATEHECHNYTCDKGHHAHCINGACVCHDKVHCTTDADCIPVCGDGLVEACKPNAHHGQGDCHCIHHDHDH